MKSLAILLLSYLMGCFSTGYYLVLLRTGEDIRELGTGSTGGRNVARFLGPRGFIITGIGDSLKAMLAVWFAITVGASYWVVFGSIIAVILGHIWPVQLSFRGGKGISAAFGALLIYDYRFLIIWLVIAIVLWVVTRQITISGLIAILFTPIASLFLHFDKERLILILVLLEYCSLLTART